jgi:hypothetical protein
MADSTRIDYGNSLLDTVRQPTGSYHIDAYGLAQAQLTFAIDTDTLYDTMDALKTGVLYQDHSLMSFEMKSYKYSAQLGKGKVSMITVDYMGIARSEGYTDTQIVGVSTTTAQPIETHPNFTKVLDETIGDGSDTQILAGPPEIPARNFNNPIWIQDTNDPKVFKFNGFGLMNDGDPYSADNVNPKAGIRQYLKPMLNVRGTIFFKDSTGPNIIANSVGKTILESAKVRMLGQTDVFGATNADMCLLTSANVEVIGTPTNPAGYKVTYDIMITDAKDSGGASVGWDYDIYGEMADSPF